jgi:hypothetical protein
MRRLWTMLRIARRTMRPPAGLILRDARLRCAPQDEEIEPFVT